MNKFEETVTEMGKGYERKEELKQKLVLLKLIRNVLKKPFDIDGYWDPYEKQVKFDEIRYSELPKSEIWNRFYEIKVSGILFGVNNGTVKIELNDGYTFTKLPEVIEFLKAAGSDLLEGIE